MNMSNLKYTDKYDDKVKERFASNHTAPMDGSCWEWTGKNLVDNRRHSSLMIDGKYSPIAILSYQMYIGPVDMKEEDVFRKCENVKCVNPTHLHLVKKSTPRYNEFVRKEQHLAVVEKDKKIEEYRKRQELILNTEGEEQDKHIAYCDRMFKFFLDKEAEEMKLNPTITKICNNVYYKLGVKEKDKLNDLLMFNIPRVIIVLINIHLNTQTQKSVDNKET